MTASERPSPRRLQIAVAVASATLLSLQVAYTRVLSVVVDFHMVFFVLSAAMLGVGLPGAFLILRPPSARTAPRALLVAAVSIPASVVILLRFGSPNLDRTLPIATVCLLCPFLSLGTALAALLIEAEGPAFRKVYAADLAGGAAGALGILALLDWVSTPSLVALTALPIALLVALLGTRTEKILSGLTVAAVAFLVVARDPLRVEFTKHYDERRLGAHRIAERWSSTIRLAVFDRLFFALEDKLFTWGPGRNAPPAPLSQYWIEQDGGAGTPVLRFDGDLGKFVALDYDVTTAGYQIRGAKDAFIVGPGGGRDILSALRQGVSRVHAVEVNRGMVELMNGQLRAFSGGIYTYPGVTVEFGEARSRLARADEHFDALQISLIDSWAATAAGAHALSEGYLYTVEAMETYLGRVTPRGVLSISRWKGMESSRLLGTVAAAGRALGWSDVPDHILALGAWNVVTVLVSPTPFSEEERRRARSLAELRGWDVVHPVPGSDAGRCVESAGSACSRPPATDDRPFFFITDRAFERIYGSSAGLSRIREVALMAMLGLILALFGPLYRERKTVPVDVIAGGSYYALIGIAFMIVEVGLTHRFVEYVGHPTTSAAVVLTGLLLGTGTGAYFLPASRTRAWLLGAPLVIVVIAVLSPIVFAHTQGLASGVRGLIAGLFAAAIAIQLGAWFPSGLVRFEERRKAWYWLVNGTASVVGGMLGLGLGIDYGFQNAFFVAAALYVAAAGLFVARPRVISA